MIRLAALIALLLLPALGAQAAPTMADEARLRGVIDRLIAGQKAAFEKTGGTFVASGEPLIETADTYYAVTLPDITLVHPNRAQTTLGLIAINASPTGKNQWNITMALPTPIVTRGAGGQVDSELAIGRQHFTGIWDENFQNFTSLKTLYEDVTLSLPDGSDTPLLSSASIGKMGYGFALADPGKDKTDLDFRFALENLKTIGESRKFARLLPGDASVNLTLKDLPIDQLGEIQQNLMTPGDMAGSPLWITQLLTKAGSRAIINKLHLRNDSVALNLTGALQPSETAPFHHTGNLVLDVTNIDQILLGLNEAAGALKPEAQGKLQALRVALTMMAALGQNVEEGGVTAKRYDVEMKENGQVILNGTDFSALLGSRTEDTTAAR